MSSTDEVALESAQNCTLNDVCLLLHRLDGDSSISLLECRSNSLQYYQENIWVKKQC